MRAQTATLLVAALGLPLENALRETHAFPEIPHAVFGRGPWRRTGLRGRFVGVPTAFSPLDLLPVGMWSAIHSVVTESGLEISNLTNVGTKGSTLDLSQGVAGARPDLIVSSANMNGQPVIHGDGGDYLASLNTDAWEMVADGDSMVAVSVHYTAVASAAQVVLSTQSNTAGGINLRPESDGTLSRSLVEDNAGINRIPLGPTTPTSAVSVQALVYTGAVSPGLDSMQTWIDGVAGTALTVDQGIIRPALGSGTRAWIMGANSSGASGWDGEIGLQLLFDRLLTPSEDALLTAYINATFGTSLTGITQ